MQNTGNYVRDALALFAGYGDAEALVAIDQRRFTYCQLSERIRDTAAMLWGHGIRPGMTVALMVTNPAESFFAQLGAHLLGCRTVFAMRVAPRPFLDRLLGHVSADAFVYEVEPSYTVGPELARAAAPLPIFCIGAGGLGPDLTDPPHGADLPFDISAVRHEPHTLFQTSGTTGTPKLVRHGDRFFRSIAAVSAYYRPDDGRAIRHLSTGGTWHAAGQSAALMTWYGGGTLVNRFTWTVPDWLATIEREQINSSLLSPSSLYALLDDPQLAAADVGGLYALTIGTAAVSPARLAQAISVFGSAINVVYGMSEITIITALEHAAEHAVAHPGRLASCGRPWGDTRVEIRDDEGQPLPPGAAGHIWVSGELVTDEYWGMPDLTASALVDGWLSTGDIGQFDEDGYLYIVDRAADMIISEMAGIKVYCRPVEDVLTEHPQVSRAAVIGRPGEMGEVVHAYVIRVPGADTTAAELRALALGRLNRVWAPAEIEFVDELPLTGSGKVDKKALRALYTATHPR